MSYYITYDTCEIVADSHTHDDFACAWEEARALAAKLEDTLYILHSNGQKSWEVTSDGEIDPMPVEPHAVLIAKHPTLKGKL